MEDEIDVRGAAPYQSPQGQAALDPAIAKLRFAENKSYVV